MLNCKHLEYEYLHNTSVALGWQTLVLHKLWQCLIYTNSYDHFQVDYLSTVQNHAAVCFARYKYFRLISSRWCNEPNTWMMVFSLISNQPCPLFSRTISTFLLVSWSEHLLQICFFSDISLSNLTDESTVSAICVHIKMSHQASNSEDKLHVLSKDFKQLIKAADWNAMSQTTGIWRVFDVQSVI